MPKSILDGSKIEDSNQYTFSIHCRTASMNRVHSVPWQFTHPSYATVSLEGPRRHLIEPFMCITFLECSDTGFS